MKVLVLIVLGVIASTFCMLGAATQGWIPVADFFPSHSSGTIDGWYPLINLRNNAFLFWRTDAVVTYLSRYWSTEQARVQICTGAAAILLAGMTLVHLRISRHRFPLISLLNAILFLTVALGVFGFDQVILCSLAWLPFLILALLGCAHGAPTFGFFLVLCLVFSVRMSKSANELAPFLSLLGICAAALLSRSMTGSARPVLTRSFFIASALILTIAAIPVLQAPSPNFQEYPWQAHVVADDGIAQYVHPLIGPGPNTPFIDREMLKAYFAPMSLLLVLIALAVRTGFGHAFSPAARTFATMACTLALVAVLDTCLPEELAYIAPAASLSRIVPGAFLFPVAEFCVASTILCLLFALTLERRLALALLLVAALTGTARFVLQGSLPRLHHDFSGLNAEEERLVVSPSFPVIHELGNWVLHAQERVARTEFRASNSVPVTVQASHRKAGNEPEKMFDLDRLSRWSAGRAFQAGDEWLYLRFASPLQLSGIELAPSHFKSDFPRALRISTVTGCPDSLVNTALTAHAEVISFKPWQGSLDYTEKGFPFYTAQTRVRAFFPRQIDTQCLLIEQLGKTSGVDWSVAEMRLGFETTEENNKTESIDEDQQ